LGDNSFPRFCKNKQGMYIISLSFEGFGFGIKNKLFFKYKRAERLKEGAGKIAKLQFIF
jgi:hypothetical protein